jgi:hypothetical protein
LRRAVIDADAKGMSTLTIVGGAPAAAATLVRSPVHPVRFSSSRTLDAAATHRHLPASSMMIPMLLS